MKKIFVLISMLMVVVNIFGVSLKGKITDEYKQSLMGASVFLPELNKGTITDIQGNFELKNLPEGKMKIQISYIGYANEIISLHLLKKDQVLNVSLHSTVIEAEEIVVTGGYNATQHENAVKIDVLKLKMHEMKSTPNFMEMLTKIPGVDMISKGSGIAKPVIRGLSMNDVLVLNHGARYENYQYSSHHPLGIDEFGIEQVEIVKGPASLLYGSDAIGGVVNFIREKPAAVGTLEGDYNLQLFSNSLGMTNNLGLKASNGKFYGGFRAGHKTNADYLQGGGLFVPNSRFNDLSFKTNVGWVGKLGNSQLFYEYNEQKIGLVEDEAIEILTERGRKNDVFGQSIQTQMASFKNTLFLMKNKMEVNVSYQSTTLAHNEEEVLPSIEMNLKTLNYETKVHVPASELSQFIVGFQGFSQWNTNQNSRETILLPDAFVSNQSLFGLMQYDLTEKFRVQAGFRYDWRILSTQQVGEDVLGEDFRDAVDKDYTNPSGSLGATWHLTDDWLIRSNLASAYRTPNLAELTSRGPHELRFEVGDNQLLPEFAYEADLSMHFHKTNFTLDIAGYYNFIQDYIYIAPTGLETSQGLPVYQYRQSDAKLFGGEAGIHFHPEFIHWLHMQSTFATVIGKQTLSEQFLPFIPADKFNLEIRAEKDQLLFLHDTYVKAGFHYAFAQQNPAPEEEATDAYGLIDLQAGGEIVWQKQKILLNVGINNLFDVKYIDHLSTLKEAGFFNPGRNITFSMKIPFGSDL